MKKKVFTLIGIDKYLAEGMGEGFYQLGTNYMPMNSDE